MKNLHRFASLLLICLVLCFLVISSNEVVQCQTLNKKLPSVYLSFKEYLNDGEGDEMVRMILRNNTKWPIIVTRLTGSALKGDIPLAYIIELATGCREERLTIDVIMRVKLMPGKAVSFAVPSDDFSQGSKIYVEFAYSWEKQEYGKPYLNEPVHRAYFSALDLPPQSNK